MISNLVASAGSVSVEWEVPARHNHPVTNPISESVEPGATSRWLVERFYDEVWNSANESVARAILHPDFAFRGSLGPTRIGHEGFIAYVRSTHAALGEYTCIIDDLIATRDRVAAKMTFTGIHRGVFFGMPATGLRITWAGSAFFTTDGHRITKLWVLGDIDAIKSQLGAGANAPFSE